MGTILISVSRPTNIPKLFGAIALASGDTAGEGCDGV